MLESHQNFVVFSIFWPQDCYPHDTEKNCKRWSIQITPQWHWASWKFEAWTKNHPVEDTLNRICGFLAEGSSQALEKCWPKLDDLNLDVYMPAGVSLCRIIYAVKCEHTAYMRQAKNMFYFVKNKVLAVGTSQFYHGDARDCQGSTVLYLEDSCVDLAVSALEICEFTMAMLWKLKESRWWPQAIERNVFWSLTLQLAKMNPKFVPQRNMIQYIIR